MYRVVILLSFSRRCCHFFKLVCAANAHVEPFFPSGIVYLNVGFGLVILAVANKQPH